jgi:hypothetical protein
MARGAAAAKKSKAPDDKSAGARPVTLMEWKYVSLHVLSPVRLAAGGLTSNSVCLNWIFLYRFEDGDTPPTSGVQSHDAAHGTHPTSAPVIAAVSIAAAATAAVVATAPVVVASTTPIPLVPRPPSMPPPAVTNGNGMHGAPVTAPL